MTTRRYSERAICSRFRCSSTTSSTFLRQSHEQPAQERKVLLYLVAIIAGGSTAHALVPDAGPLAVSTELGIDIGQFMIVGGLIAIPAAVVPGILYAQWMDRRMDIPLRDALGTTAEDLIRQTEREGQDLPGTFEALLPIILVIGLVASDALFGVFCPMVQWLHK